MPAPLRSMTGFGEARGVLPDGRVVEVRLASVNGRFLEIQVRSFPRLEMGELEPAIRAVLGEQLQRGRVSVTIVLQSPAGAGGGLGFRWEVAEELQRELARRPPGLELAPVSLRDLLSLPGFLADVENRLGEEERAVLLAVVAQARDVLVGAREQEGSALLPTLSRDLEAVAQFAVWLGNVNSGVRQVLLERLRGRLVEVLPAAAVPEDRLLMEAAIAADRADVSEEVQRIESHLAQARRLLAAGGAVGKRLEFLLQELLREVNTAASKCREAGMGERVIEAKAALERLREQVANLE